LPSISAGLAASTVTPTITPPEASCATPAIELCADAIDGSRVKAAIIAETERMNLTLAILNSTSFSSLSPLTGAKPQTL
jgi:hypothetical protein